MKRCKQRHLNPSVILWLAFCLWLLAPSVQAQETQEVPESTQMWRKKPAFSLRLGPYFSSLDTKLRLDSDFLGRGTEIDLEDTLQLDTSPTVFRGDLEIRVVKWLSLDLGYYAVNRSKTVVIDRDIQIGDTIFELNQTVIGKLDTDFLRAHLKFYIVNKPRTEFGVWLGANVLFLDFSLRAEELGITLSEEEDVWAPIPAIGIHVSYTLFPNFYIFGKGGYFYYGLSEDLKFSNWSFDINVHYYFLKFLGAGMSYDFNKFQLDGEGDILSGKAMNRLSGVQVYVLVGF